MEREKWLEFREKKNTNMIVLVSLALLNQASQYNSFKP